MHSTLRKYTLLLLLLLPLLCNAQESIIPDAVKPSKHGVFRGFSGGMMLHLGYQYGTAAGFLNSAGEEACLRSVCYGVGGAARIHLMKHLRIGAEGYVSTMPLKSQGDGSNIRTGWGGALADGYLTLGKVQLFAGGTLGGGAQRCTHVYSGETPDIESFQQAWAIFKQYGTMEETYPAEFTKRGFFVFDPFLGMEYAVTAKLHLVIKADYMLSVHKNKLLTPSGPRLYLGFMFTH